MTHWKTELLALGVTGLLVLTLPFIGYLLEGLLHG
jgi:hypothetical protein